MSTFYNIDISQVLRFSMDWSDYAHLTLAVFYGIVCATVASSSIRWSWYNVPWKWVATIAWDLVSLSVNVLEETYSFFL